MKILVAINNLTQLPARSWDSSPLDQVSRSSVLLSQILPLCVTGCVFEHDPVMFRMLRKLSLLPPLDFWMIVLNPLMLSRELQSIGQFRLALRRISHVAPIRWPSIGLELMRRLPAMLKRDFRATSLFLVLSEVYSVLPVQPRVVLLHENISDLVLANCNEEFLAGYAHLVRDRMRAEPGIVTNNLGYMLPWLDKCQSDIQIVVSPINVSGYRMKPSQQECEMAIIRSNREVVSLFRSLPRGRVVEQLRYLRGLGINSCVFMPTNALDVAELMDANRQ
jgi:hypothetical protein